MGYKLIPEKPGYLEIDADQAEVVRTAFQALQLKKTLSHAAKWLNEQGHRVRRKTEGGGSRPRLGHFTVQNLANILTNRAYLGIRSYKARGESKETRANWPAIIDELTFQRVQEVLLGNRKRKPETEKRWPFAFTGLVSCASCGERMVGKSAHGNGGKVPYYEHGWATRKQGCLVQKCFNCSPFRVQAKKLEPAVWEKVEELIWNPAVSEMVIDKAKQLHAKRTQTSDVKRLKDKINTLTGQIDVLAERLAMLPKAISPEPVFRQMEKIEAIKTEEETRLRHIEREFGPHEMPASLSSYRALLAGLNRIHTKDNAQAAREKIVHALVHGIKIVTDGYEIEYLVGRDYVERGLASAGPRPFHGGQAPNLSIVGNNRVHLSGRSNLPSMARGSNSLTNGGPSRTRTWDHPVMSGKL